MAAPTSTNEVTARKLSASISALWAKIKSTFQTLGNLVTSWGSTPSDTKYPSEKLVKTALDAKAPNAVTTEAAIATGDKLLFSDDSDNSKTKRMSAGFDTSKTNQVLKASGTFGSVLYADEDWGGKFRNTLSPFDNYAFKSANCFFGAKPSAIRVEYSTDGGTTWTDYGLTSEQKQAIFNQYAGFTVFCGKNTHIQPGYTGSIVGTKDLSNDNIADQRLRITICESSLANEGGTGSTDRWLYCNLRRIGIYCTTNSSGQGGLHCVFEKRTRGNFKSATDSWVTVGDFNIQGDSGWNSLPCDNGYAANGSIRLGSYSDSYYSEVRFTVWANKLNASPAASQTGNPGINKIVAYSELLWTNVSSNANMANFGAPYTVDASTGVAHFSKGITSGVAIPVSSGGTGQTTAVNACNAFINALSTGDATPTGEDYYVAQFAGGGTTTKTYHRRPIKALWEYIKAQISSVLGLTATSYGGNAATATTATNYNTSTGTIKTALAGKSDTSHTHGNITNAGGITASGVTIANGDSLVIVDSSETNKLVAKTSVTFDGSTTTKALSQKGTFETFLTSHQSITGKLNTDGSNVAETWSHENINKVLKNISDGADDVYNGDDFIASSHTDAGEKENKFTRRPSSKVLNWLFNNGQYSMQIGGDMKKFGWVMGDYVGNTAIGGWHIAKTDISNSSGYGNCVFKALVVIDKFAERVTYNETGYNANNFVGILDIYARMDSATVAVSNIKKIGRLTSFYPNATSSDSKGWAVFAKVNQTNYTIDWYIGRGGQTSLSVQDIFKYSKISIMPLQNNGSITLYMDRVTSTINCGTAPDDSWQMFKTPLIAASDFGKGSSSLPVYITANANTFAPVDAQSTSNRFINALGDGSDNIFNGDRLIASSHSGTSATENFSTRNTDKLVSFLFRKGLGGWDYLDANGTPQHDASMREFGHAYGATIDSDNGCYGWKIGETIVDSGWSTASFKALVVVWEWDAPNWEDGSGYSGRNFVGILDIVHRMNSGSVSDANEKKMATLSCIVPMRTENSNANRGYTIFVKESSGTHKAEWYIGRNTASSSMNSKIQWGKISIFPITEYCWKRFMVQQNSSITCSGTLDEFWGNRGSVWVGWDSFGAVGDSDRPVYIDSNRRIQPMGSQLNLPASANGIESRFRATYYGSKIQATLVANSSYPGVYCRNNSTGNDTSGGWMCYRKSDGTNVFNGKSNDSDKVDGFHFVVGTIGTDANTIYFG